VEKPLATVQVLGLASAAVNTASAVKCQKTTAELHRFIKARWGSYVLISVSVHSYSDSPFGRLISKVFEKVMEGYYE